MKINLTNFEFAFGAQVGLMRGLMNKKKGRKDAYGCPNDGGWTQNIEGSCAEYAISKLLNVHWDGSMENLKACDVIGLNYPIEVRSTSHNGGRLILHPKDKDNNIFILLIGVAPNFEAKGWIYAKDGKKEEYYTDPLGNRAAYFIPQEKLNPMSGLMDLLNIKE